MAQFEDVIYRFMGVDKLSGMVSTLGKNFLNFGSDTDSVLNKVLVDYQRINEAGSFSGFNQGLAGVDTSTNVAQSKFGAFSNFVKTHSMLVGGAMLAMAGVIISAYAVIGYESVKAAERNEDDWTRFTVTLGKSGTEMEQVKSQYSGTVESIVNDTGRMREDIIKGMGELSKFGLTSTDDLKSSMDSIGALAEITQGSVPQMTESWAGLINKPTIMVRSLSSLGINTTDFNKVLKDNNLTMKSWKDLTVEQRAHLLNLTVTMQGGQKANDAYKHTLTGMETSLKNTANTFMVNFGMKILPIVMQLASIVVPALTHMVNAFAGLPAPIQDILLVLPLVVAGFMAFGGIYILLKNAKDGIVGLKDAVKNYNKEGCEPKTCKVNYQSGCGSDDNSNSNNSNNRGKKKPKKIPKSKMPKVLSEEEQLIGEGESRGGALQGLKDLFGNEKGTVSSGDFMGKLLTKIGIGGEVASGAEKSGGGILSKLGGLGGKLGGLGGKLGMLGDVGMGVGDAIPGLGEILMGATAGYGAYTGWNNTKGNWGDKGKGAVGGAVSSLSMGLISQDQVVGAENKAGSAISGAGKGLSKDFTEANDKVLAVQKATVDKIKSSWNTGVNYIKGAWGNSVKFVGSIWNQGVNNIETGISNVKRVVKGVTNTVSNDWNGLTKDITNGWKVTTGFVTSTVKTAGDDVNKVWTLISGAFTTAENTITTDVKNIANTITTDLGNVLPTLKSLYCAIAGCSPGLVPAFKKLGKSVPEEMAKVLPHLNNLRTVIPELSGSGLRIGSTRTYHTWTIDASHMSESALEQMIVRINTKFS